MALDSYDNLKTALATFADVSATQFSGAVDDIIRIAEERIWRDLRCKEMEASLSATISVSTVAIPSNFLDLKFAYYVDSGGTGYNLRRMDPQWMRANYPEGLTGGRPDYIGTEGSTFIFKPEPDVTTYVLHGMYWAKTDPVSTTAHAVFQRYPTLYLYGGLVELERILSRHDKIVVWESKYREILRQANLENTRGEGFGIAHYL